MNEENNEGLALDGGNLKIQALFVLHNTLLKGGLEDPNKAMMLNNFLIDLQTLSKGTDNTATNAQVVLGNIKEAFRLVPSNAEVGRGIAAGVKADLGKDPLNLESTVNAALKGDNKGSSGKREKTFLNTLGQMNKFLSLIFNLSSFFDRGNKSSGDRKDQKYKSSSSSNGEEEMRKGMQKIDEIFRELGCNQDPTVTLDVIDDYEINPDSLLDAMKQIVNLYEGIDAAMTNRASDLPSPSPR